MSNTHVGGVNRYAKSMSSRTPPSSGPALRKTNGSAISWLRTSWSQWRAGSPALHWIGIILIAVWVGWYATCLTQRPLARAVPTATQKHPFTSPFVFEPFIGIDFHHNYNAVRIWRSGGNPWDHVDGDPGFDHYVYPPFALVAFSWCQLFPPGPSLTMTGHDLRVTQFYTSEPAIFLWNAITIALVTLGAALSWRYRQRLALKPLPLLFLIGVTVLSYPVVFEFERGNCNVLVLLAIVLTTAALAWNHPRRADLVIGLAVAAAIGIKPTSIVLLPGLMTLRRYRAAAIAVAALVVQAVLLAPEFQQYLPAFHHDEGIESKYFVIQSHAIIAVWRALWTEAGLPRVAELRAQLVVTVALIGCVAPVAWQLWRHPRRDAVAWPYLLWLTAVGTMLAPIAYDYNLLYVPLLVLAAWDRSDPWYVQLVTVAILPWWQPFFIGLTGPLWLVYKVITVITVGVLVTRRLGALSADPAAVPVPVLAAAKSA